MEEFGSFVFFISIVSLIVLMGALPRCAYGRKVEKQLRNLQIEAVNHGAAEWKVQEDGSTVFTWKK